MKGGETLDTRGRQKRKAGEVDVAETRQVPKKKKNKSKEKRHQHEPESLTLDADFIKKCGEGFLADPVTASVNVILHMGDVARIKYEEAERNAAVDRQKREEAEKNLSLAQLSLKAVRADLEVLKKAREDLAKEKENWTQKKAELDGRIAELQDQEKKDKAEITSLKARIAELEKSVEEAQNLSAPTADADRIAELERMLETEKAYAARAVKAALNQRKVGFNLALQQTKVYQPGYEFPEAIFSSDYQVEGDSIIQVDRQTKISTVIFSNK